MQRVCLELVLYDPGTGRDHYRDLRRGGQIGWCELFWCIAVSHKIVTAIDTDQASKPLSQCTSS